MFVLVHAIKRPVHPTFHPIVPALQRVRQFSQSQHICSSSSMTISQCWPTHCSAPSANAAAAAVYALWVSAVELASSHFTVNDITRQLQGLHTQEHTLYMQYMWIIGHEVEPLAYMSFFLHVAPSSIAVYYMVHPHLRTHSKTSTWPVTICRLLDMILPSKM